MAYTRLHWEESVTPLSAQNMNNIEDGIEELQNQKVDKVSGKGLSTNDYTTAEKNKLASVLSLVYPVGSIYMSVNSTNPGTLFGGTWVAWGSGRVPVGVNTSDSSFNTVEKTGGEKTHSLTVSEIPSHTHSYTLGSRSRVSTEYENLFSTAYIFPAPEIETGATGGGNAHNILQPYITCYMWKRTA